MDFLTNSSCILEDGIHKSETGSSHLKGFEICIVCSQRITDENTAPPQADIGQDLNCKNMLDLLFQLLDISYKSIESVLLAPLFSNGLPTSEAKFCYDCDLWISYGLDLKKKLRTVKEKIISNALQSHAQRNKPVSTSVQSDGNKLQSCVSGMVKQCFSKCRINLTRDNSLVPPVKTRKRKCKRIKTEPIDAETEKNIPETTRKLRPAAKSVNDKEDSIDPVAGHIPATENDFEFVQEIVEISMNDDDQLWEPEGSERGERDGEAGEDDNHAQDCTVKPKTKVKRKSAGPKSATRNSRREQIVVQDPEEHPCQYCDRKFTCSSLLVVHINEEHSPIADVPLKFSCSVCKVELNQEAYKVLDGEVVGFSYFEGEKRVYSSFTEICESHFSGCSAGASASKDSRSKSRERKRKYTKPNFGSFKCEICGKKMTSPRYYNDHMNYHLKTNEAQCPFCPQAFPMERALSQHITAIHRLDRMFNDHYSCRYCQKPFMGQGPNLESGQFVQEDSELLVAFAELHAACKIKSKSEKSMPVLPCKFCQETFNTYKHLIAHEIRAHTRNFRYFCETCGTGYVTAVDLYQHQKAHVPVRSHQCELCPANYKRASHLKDHMRLHTGEAPYICKVCGKCFNNSSRLRAHEDTHNQERTEACKYCGKLYRSKANVYSHIFVVHKKLRKPRINPKKAAKMAAESQVIEAMEEAEADLNSV